MCSESQILICPMKAHRKDISVTHGDAFPLLVTQSQSVKTQ